MSAENMFLVSYMEGRTGQTQENTLAQLHFTKNNFPATSSLGMLVHHPIPDVTPLTVDGSYCGCLGTPYLN